jgi:hypothetical protein
LRRRVALNLSLALLVAGLAVFALLSPPAREPESPRPLVADTNQNAKSIQVERAGKPSLEFTRETGGWTLRAPIVAPAHPSRIRDLLALSTLPASAALGIKGNALPRFGLSPPLATLSLGGDEFEFGITDGLDGRRYVRHQRQVQLVPDNVYPLLTQNVDFFIDTRLLREGLRPERIAAPHRAAWFQDGKWHSDPAPAAGEPSAESIASAWEAAQALSVASGVDADSGQPVTLTFAQGITIAFEVVQNDDQVVLLRRDLNLRYQLDPEQASALMLVPGAR